MYKFSGKTIFLVRSATYSPSDYKADVYLKAYMALLSEYEDLAGKYIRLFSQEAIEQIDQATQK